MKSTGVVRKLDELGRVVLPVEIRRTLDISVRDSLEIFVEEDRIILRKFHPSCIFCNDARNVKSFMDKLVCERCLEMLRTGHTPD